MQYRSVFRAGLFEGQIIVVTGGGSGIGRCTAHELAALGAKVALVGRKPEKLEKVREEIAAAGGSRHHPRLRHPRRRAGLRHGGGRARRARPHRRPGEQRRRPVSRAAARHLAEGLGGGGAHQPHRRLPRGARMLPPLDGEARRRHGQHERRHVGRHAGHGALRRGACRHGELHRVGRLRMGGLRRARERRGAGLDRLQRLRDLSAGSAGVGEDAQGARFPCSASAPSRRPRPPSSSCSPRRPPSSPARRSASTAACSNARPTWPLVPHKRSKAYNGFPLYAPPKFMSEE